MNQATGEEIRFSPNQGPTRTRKALATLAGGVLFGAAAFAASVGSNSDAKEVEGVPCDPVIHNECDPNGPPTTLIKPEETTTTTVPETTTTTVPETTTTTVHKVPEPEIVEVPSAPEIVEVPSAPEIVEVPSAPEIVEVPVPAQPEQPVPTQPPELFTPPVTE